MANRNKYDNNLKSFENPLLSAAAAEFPIENFTNNTFLLPISHQTKDDITADIEEDSFLGQNPKPSSNEPLFKAFGTAQSQRVEAQDKENKQNISFYNPTLFQSSNPHSTSTKSQHPIPEFTQSIVSSLPPYKPTIQNPLVQNFQGLNLNTTPGVRQAPSPNQSSLFPQQTAHSHSDLSNLTLLSKIPSQPVTESVSLRSSPGATTHLFTPLPVSSSISEPNLCPIKPPTFLTNTLKDSIGIQSEQNASVPLLSSPSAPQSSSFISTNQQINPLPSLFSTSQSPKSHFALYNPSQPQPQSSSVLGSVTDLNGPPLHSSFTPNPQIPLFNPSSSTINKPSSGTVPNTYRLSNLKRPVYTRPPDLAISTPIMTNIDTITPPSIPPQASLFTPAPVQSECSEEIYNASTPATLPPNIQTSHDSQTAVIPPSFASLAQGLTYRPVYHHWFFRKDIEGKVLWHPFSMTDSLALEAAFTSPNISPDTKVATDGGRYDVDVLRRRRIAVYWEEDAREVRRCSWFVKGSIDARYIPYEESIATMLEDEYRQVSSTNEWNKEVNLPDGEVIIFHSPNAIAQHSRSSSPDAWGNATQMQQKPRIVKRGMDEFDISEGEPEKVDHLLFLVHGIGKFCDLKFRPVAEVVDDFRSICLQLLQSHFKGAIETGTVSRIEVLPVPWHQALHSEDITKKLNNITLQSIPRLRQFTNDTLSDILFYTSPVFCEKISLTVGNEMNRLYALYRSRNPEFQGSVSVGGHSLGSVILFDMLCNQKPIASPLCEPELMPPSIPEDASLEEEIKDGLGCFKTKKARLSRSVSYVSMGRAGTGQPYITYPHLMFNPSHFFALGSPIGMFLTVRGIDLLGEDFKLPTCPTFFNIFHPFDPVAFRTEPLINAEFTKYPPLQIPHHKGRKRMHLELKDTIEQVGAALKQKLYDSMKSTWNTVYQLAMFHKSDNNALEQEVNKVIEDQIIAPLKEEVQDSVPPDVTGEIVVGCLNEGRRVDYVLQEAPFESFNEYIFALTSHTCYWESEDTLLLILKEIYNSKGITPDNQVHHQILPFETPERNETDMVLNYSSHQYTPLSNSPVSYGMDPTAPVSENVNLGPPPKMGFVRK